MSLTRYQQKRQFKSTSEPKGDVLSLPKGKEKKRNGALHFVVQKHAASHLHYDFRLEMEGVLKSWAIPKGPSLNPDDKRLAMEVEDHPYDYKDFEGNIPKGNYGAGNVIVWDEGTYEPVNGKERQGKQPVAVLAGLRIASGPPLGGEPVRKNKEQRTKKKEEEKLLDGLHKGHISFTLHGKKLSGEYSLIKLKGRQKNSWLLIKKKDKYASKKDVLKKNKSVLSGKSLEEIEKSSSRQQQLQEKKEKEKNGNIKRKNNNHPKLKQRPAPTAAANSPTTPTASSTFSPMLAYITPTPFDDPNWVFEIKYDGYRAIAVIDGKGKVDLFSRNRISFNKKFEPIVDDLKKIKHAAVLDGEIVVEDETGHSHFQLLQKYQKTGNGILKYYVFDILSLEGRDLQNLTLLQRKELLKSLLKKYKFSNVFYSDHFEEKGKDFYDLAIKHKLEGVIAKKADSPYRSGRRSRDWLKIKITNEEEAIIAGITEPAGSRKHFGSLLLGQYDEGVLKYIGNCGTGFTEKVLKELYDKFKPYFTKSLSFKEKIKGFGKIQWIKPHFVCEVKFTEKTQDGILRHPVFLGLRIDKEAKDVTIEKPIIKSDSSSWGRENGQHLAKSRKDGDVELKKEAKSDYDLKIGEITLHLTNQDKIYFPEDKITKGDVVNYYNGIAEVILPYLKNRPQSMLRFPNGIHNESFFQKDVDTDKIPSWLKTKKIYSVSNKKYIDYLLCNDKATLIYMANLGCIDINPWNSTIEKIENPDWAVIDLDPEKIDFKAVVKTALVVKEVMDELEAECYCKTSGATGLHIYIPLDGRYDYEVVKKFSQLIAHTVNVRIPEITSIERLPKNRMHKVYVDFLQNRKGQTLAAPYSLRPRMGAPVSAPLEWGEVNENLSPLNFTIKNIFNRLEKKGDLWKPVIGKGVNLDKIIKKIN